MRAPYFWGPILIVLIDYWIGNSTRLNKQMKWKVFSPLKDRIPLGLTYTIRNHVLLLSDYWAVVEVLRKDLKAAILFRVGGATNVREITDQTSEVFFFLRPNANEKPISWNNEAAKLN